MWIKKNLNPKGKSVGDCVIRAISMALNQSWDTTYLDMCSQGLIMCDMPSSNAVWGMYLYKNGFTKHAVKSQCPMCYTVKDFCEEFNKGTYVLCLSGHVICVIDGNYYDTWDSGEETPIYYWKGE